MTETSRCIECRHFTLRPRVANGGYNDWLRELDRNYIPLGLGRCAHTRESHIWHSAESPRECGKAAAIGADLVQARRTLIAKRQA